MTIWVSEQIDPVGLVYACIASESEDSARECRESFARDLNAEQEASGWQARVRPVSSWDDVPVTPVQMT